MRGRNVTKLINVYNLAISTSRAGFAFRTTAMEDELTGFDNHHLAYKAALGLIRQMLEASVGGAVLDEELPGGLLNLLDKLSDAILVDKRLLTCHASILKPPALQQLLQRIDLTLGDECSEFGTQDDFHRRDCLLAALPYLDADNSYCLHNHHPCFSQWLDFRFKQKKKRCNDPAKIGPPWPLFIAGRSLVRLHRYGLSHPYGVAQIAPETPYDTSDVLKLFKFRFSKYPAEAQDGFSKAGWVEKLDMPGLCPEKEEFAGWTDVKMDEDGKTILLM
ncbi:uncharacterized protein [Triticum aestivum]|nr:uncharacterized protein LOC123070261 isoform X2 [Triticum aestivum]